MLASGRHCIRMGDVGLPTAAWSMALRARPGSWRCCELDFDTRAHTRARTHARTHAHTRSSKQATRHHRADWGAERPKKSNVDFSNICSVGIWWAWFLSDACSYAAYFYFWSRKKSELYVQPTYRVCTYISRRGGGLRGASPTWFNSLPRSAQGSPGKVESARIGSAESGLG